MQTRSWVAAAIAGAAIGTAAWWWWSSRVPAPAPAEPAAIAPAPPAPAASAPSRYVLAPDAAASAAELHGEADIVAALMQLLGREAVIERLQTSDFPRRVVATVDNLGRASAPSSVWPVSPAAGRFGVSGAPGATVIADDNAARHVGFVRMVERVDAAQAVDLYLRLHPLLQRAYEEQGYPGRDFHARLLEVIDLLLATPEPTASPAVRLVEVKGPVASTRPWVRYEFADPKLESLAAGQKLLLRLGLQNERRLKARLAALRAELVARSRQLP